MGKGGVGALNKKARIEATRPLAEKKGGGNRTKKNEHTKRARRVGFDESKQNRREHTEGSKEKGKNRKTRDTEKHRLHMAGVVLMSPKQKEAKIEKGKSRQERRHRKKNIY